MFRFTVPQIIVIVLFALIAILGINYYAEMNRLVLLLGVYPACLFGALGIIAWCEK